MSLSYLNLFIIVVILSIGLRYCDGMTVQQYVQLSTSNKSGADDLMCETKFHHFNNYSLRY